MTGAHAPRPRLRTRLIAGYAATLCVVLLATAGALRLAVGRVLERTHDESLQASAALFRQFFRVELAEYRSVEATLAHIAGELVFEDRVIDVHRPDGTLFARPGTVPSHRYPTLRAPVKEHLAPLDPDFAPGWTIEVHGSAAAMHAALRRIDLWFLASLPLIVCTAALLGWWMAGRALRPIGQLGEQLHTLDASAGARLVLDDPGDELGRLGARFNALLDRLERALGQQRRFLADAAHELRTPMARLRNRVELGRLTVQRAPREAVRAEAETTLASLDAELREASGLVQSLLALARADADAEPAAFAHGYLDDALTDEFARWREEASAAGVTLALGTFDEVWAHFDALLLRRLLGLLLDNAVRYTPAGGVVTVTLQADQGDAVLRVEDQGIGIAPEEREAVFERFHRTAAARAHRPDGSGLGLALARWIVTRHGGTITAASRADGGPGVAFVVRMPIVAPPAGGEVAHARDGIGRLPRAS